MPFTNKIRDIWDAGGALVNGWIASPNPMAAEIFSREGFDAVTIDLQHGLVDLRKAA